MTAPLSPDLVPADKQAPRSAALRFSLLAAIALGAGGASAACILLLLPEPWHSLALGAGVGLLLLGSAGSYAGWRQQQHHYREQLAAAIATEQAWRDQEACYRLLVDNATDAIACYTPAGICTYISLACQTMLGYAPTELVGQTIYDCLHPDDCEAYRHQHQHQLATRSTEVFTYRCRHQAGHYVWLEAKSRPVCDPNTGEVRETIAIARSIDHRVRAEMAQREAEEKFRTAFEQSPVGMTIRDLDGRFLQVNQAYAKLIGYSIEEVLQLTYRDLSHPDDVFPDTLLAPLLAGEESYFSIEKRLIRKNRQTLWVQIYVAVVSDATGAPRYLLTHYIDTTERRRYEASLQASKARNQAMLAAIPDLMFRVSRAGYYLSYVPSNSLRDLLAGSEQVTGQSLADLSPPATAQRKLHYLERALATGEVQVFEQSHFLQGRWQHEEVRVAPSGPDEVLFLIRNITERKESELVLRRYERAVSATVDGMGLIDREFRYLLVNQTYLDWHGWTLEETLGQFAADKLDREVFETIARPHLERALAGETVQYSHWFDYAAVGRQFISATYAPYRELDGSITGVLVMLRNLTALKEAEQALVASEERFRGAFDNAPIGMAIAEFRGDQRFLARVNAALCQLTGYDAAELQAMTVQDLTHPEEWERDRQYLQRLLAGEIESYQLEKRYRHRNGTWLWVSLSVSLVRAASGQPLYSIGHVQDISERRAAQQAILDLNESLEQRVRERTAELEAANRALEEARRAAEEASCAKSQFLANMSHELRTPLNGILGYAQLLAGDRQLSDRQQEYVQIIYDCGECLLELIEDVLDLAKIEAQRRELNLLPLRLHSFLSSIVAMVQPSAANKGLDLHYETTVNPQQGVQADARLLRQVLLNLLANAIKFTEQGRVTLRVEALPTVRPDQCGLRLAIADTGSGIDPTDQERIFQPFEQGDNPQAQWAGVGLGLAICQELVQLMGSRIYVDSQVGQGSCFWFDLLLPVSDPEAAIAPPANAPQHSIPNLARARQSVPNAADLVPPSVDDLENLYTLARKGDIGGLRAYASRLKRDRPETAAFADTLIALAREFRDREIEALLEGYRSSS